MSAKTQGPLDAAGLIGLRLSPFLARIRAVPAETFTRSCPHAILLRLPPDLRLKADPQLSLRTPVSQRRARVEARLEVLAAAVRAGADTLGAAAMLIPTPRPPEPVHLGSDPLQCEFVIGSSGVDPRHAELNWRGTRWTLTDQEAPGGTWIEERRLPAGIPFPLVGAQLVRLGDAFRALFLAPQQVHALARAASGLGGDGARLPRLGPKGIVFRDFARAAAALDEARFQTAYPLPFLLQTAGKGRRADESRLYAIPRDAQGPLVIGRAPGSSIRLDHRTVSGRHARLTQHPRVGWRIQDLESANGTWINGARIPTGVVVPLKFDSALGLGSYRTLVLAPKQVLRLVHQFARPALDVSHWEPTAPAEAPALIRGGEEKVVLFDDARPNLTGTLTMISQVQNLLIFLERGRRTGTLRFTPADGPPTEGVLIFAGGKVLAARIGPHQGRRALERVCLSPGGRYTFSSEVEPEEADLDVSIYTFLCTELGTAQLLGVGIEALRSKARAA